MPASPATPRKSSKNRRSAPVTLARLDTISSSPLGLSDSNSVRDRIRQWQEQGAKAVSSPAPSDISIAGDENADTEVHFSSPIREGEITRGADTTPRRRTSRWVDPDKKEWIREPRSSSTPRKRVVSDEHWKKRQKRSPRSTQPTPRQETAQEKRRSEAPRHSSSKIEREERRRRRKNARGSVESTIIFDENAEVQLETTPRPLRHSGKDGAVLQSDLDSGVDDDLPRRFHGRASPKQSVKERRKSLRLSPQMDERPVRRSQYVDVLERSPKIVEGSSDEKAGSIRSRNDNIISQAKEMFSRSELEKPTSQRLPSIEAWLDEQPDPFVDGDPEPVQVPAPLKTRSSRPKVDISLSNVEDANKIWSHVDSADHMPERVTSTGRRRRRRSRRSQEAAKTVTSENTDAVQAIPTSRITSPQPQDKCQDPKEESSGGLKRRGARALRTRTGSSPGKQITPEHEFIPPGRSSMVTAKPVADVLPPREEQLRPVRPCPPTGAHRLSTIASVETFHSQTELLNDTDMLRRNSKGLQRRLTTHEDLMSVLSLPRAGGSIKSARSIRTVKSRLSTATIGEVLEELEADEAKYMRELKTLVDGVIPVLLQCVLSKSDSAAAAGLFSSSGSARDDLNFTRPIVDMGVALERLKTLHRRIPTHDLNSLLPWAQTAHKVYNEYLKAWRLGFQDVIVNLAPPDEQTRTEIDEGMARDENGDVINGRGEKVDVAYLLKRPLVRIKNLAKVFARLKVLNPSAKASIVADAYDDLIKTARNRSNEEHSRLEDEAAANVDASKARDLRTLAVLSGVRVDKSRRVKARDCFSLTIHHSSGQRLDCHTELLLRSNQPGLTAGGDLLICEMENNGRWLLFPPMEISSISARYGEIDGEIVVMVRGGSSFVPEWHELLLLQTGDLEAASDWVNMLGTQPLPPKLNRASSFVNKQDIDSTSWQQDRAVAGKRLPLLPRSPSPKEVEVPIGEPSVIGRDEYERPRTAPDVYQHEESSQYRSDVVSREQPLPHLPTNTEARALPILPTSSLEPASPHDSLSGTSSPGLRRTKLASKRPARRGESAPGSPLVASSPLPTSQAEPVGGTRKISRTDEASREWMSSPSVERDASPERVESTISDITDHDPDSRPQRPHYHRAISSTPSKELPTIHRLRPSSPVSTPLTESIRDQWSSLTSGGTKSKNEKKPIKAYSKEERVDRQMSHPGTPYADDVPTPPPHRSRSPSSATLERAEARPVPPPHRSRPQERAKAGPVMKPRQQPSPRKGRHGDRRSSSPLKHEYAPSTASESDESDDESIASSSSETSEDGILEQADQATPLPSFKTAALRNTSKISPPASLPNLPADTLAPSNSASQAPYRTVPHAALQPNAPISRTIATVWSWSDKGAWESLYPDECSIVVSPGLIEAFEMSAAHSGSNPPNGDESILESSSSIDSDDKGIRPLVAVEMTPLVPLRRGTALDISVRSRPSSRSKVKTGTNIMFRSRNAEECEALYAMINQARINNPTFIALENARPAVMPNVTFNTGPGSARHSRSRSRSGSWLRFGNQRRRSSYRASSAPLSGSPSVGGYSETSVGSMSSAFSALRRFSGGSNGGKGMFNLKRSSVIRKNGRFGTSGSSSLYSSSSGTTRTGGSGSGATSPAPSQLGLVPPAADRPAASATTAPSGTINNMKIRLYVRESAARWREMGAARLSVMPAPITVAENAAGSTTPTENNSSPPGTAGDSRPPSTFIVGQPGQATGPRLPSSNHTPHRVHGNGNEKRILITGKTKGETLLDATLHESCFERIARTGIAVNVWEEHDEVAKSGGVVGGKGRTFMIQMKGEAEAAWLFSMVGRLRY
jgi:hypothetical protein